MPKKMTAKEDAVAAIERVFRDHGFEGASITRLAEATGLGRSSLYNHFPDGKPDMAVSAAARAAGEFQRLVLDPLADSGAPAVRLERAIAGLGEFYGRGDLPCLIEHLSLSDAADAAPDAASAMAQAAIAGFARLATEGGATRADARARGEQALVEVQGGLIVARAIGDKAPFKNALRRLPLILLGD